MTAEPSPRPFEFGVEASAVCLSLARSARVIARTGFGLSALLFLAGIIGAAIPPMHLPGRVAPLIGAVTALGAVPSAYAAFRLHRASISVGFVASTEGSDVPHMLDAVGSLRNAFRALTAMLALYVVAVALVVWWMFPRGG